jgi:hypothetical protein
LRLSGGENRRCARETERQYAMAVNHPEEMMKEDSCFAVPKGQAKIAQRFNAGLNVKRSRVPKGRPKSYPTRHPSAVPSGLVCHEGCFPALKRRAILKMSLRDNGTRHPLLPPAKQPDSLELPSRALRGHGCTAARHK